MSRWAEKMISTGSASTVVISPDIFGRSMESSFCPLIMSVVFIVCLCSLLIIRVSPGSPSHLKSFDFGKSWVYLVNFALRGMFFFSCSADIQLSLGDTPSQYGYLFCSI
jgi:hypothetical protein